MNLLERIERDQNDTDAKLLHMAITHHLRNFYNFHKMITRATGNVMPHINAHELNLHPSLQKKYKNTIFAFTAPLTNEQGNRRYGSAYPLDNSYVVHHAGIEALHPNNLADKPLHVVHKQMLKQLQSSYHIFRHELEHYHDHSRGLFDNTPIKDTVQYFNHPEEVRAFIAQKKHEIERAFLRNHPDQYSKDKLPLRKRITLYRDNPFEDKLHIINRHSNWNPVVSHDVWYTHLSHENRKRARNALQPIIDRYSEE